MPHILGNLPFDPLAIGRPVSNQSYRYGCGIDVFLSDNSLDTFLVSAIDATVDSDIVEFQIIVAFRRPRNPLTLSVSSWSKPMKIRLFAICLSLGWRLFIASALLQGAAWGTLSAPTCLRTAVTSFSSAFEDSLRASTHIVLDSLTGTASVSSPRTNTGNMRMPWRSA